MKFIYLYDVEQFGQKCNIPYCNNVNVGEFIAGCPKMPDKCAPSLHRGMNTHLRP